MAAPNPYPFLVFSFVYPDSPNHIGTVWELHDPQGNPAALWAAVAASIRRAIVRRGYAFFALSMAPDPEGGYSAVPRSQVFDARDITGITPQLLAEWFADMLSSDATIDIAGTVIELESLHPGAPQANVGFGWPQQRGVAGFPHSSWRGRGVTMHPKEVDPDDDATRARLSRNCGPRALITSMNPAHWTACPIEDILTQGENLAARMGLEDFMWDGHIPRFLALEQYTAWRVWAWDWPVVQTGKEFRGADWSWTPGRDRSEPDPLTIHVLYHESHWYAVCNPESFRLLERAEPHKTGERGWNRCHVCMAPVAVADGAGHICSDNRTLECSVCGQFFAHRGDLQNHMEERNEHYDPCEACGCTVFFGPSCHAWHTANGCTVVPLPAEPVAPSRTKCDSCKAVTVEGRAHVCKRRAISCGTCEETFATTELRAAHACQLRAGKRYYEPVAVHKNETVWMSHWSYDFETCRG